MWLTHCLLHQALEHLLICHLGIKQVLEALLLVLAQLEEGLMLGWWRLARDMMISASGEDYMTASLPLVFNVSRSTWLLNLQTGSNCRRNGVESKLGRGLPLVVG